MADTRLRLGPVAWDALLASDKRDRASVLDEIVRKGLLYDDVESRGNEPTIGTSANAALARLTNVTAELVTIQNASIGLIMDRFDQVLEAHKVTRGFIGSMLTEEDERAAVLDKMEAVFEIQQQRLDEMTDRLKRMAKRRDPVKDIWAEEPVPTQVKEAERGDHEEIGGRER